MRKLSLKLIPLLALPAACAGSPPAARGIAGARPSAAAPYRAVHIDTVAPDKVAQFEEARHTWIAELQRAHASDGRGLFVQVGANRFYTLRSFDRFGEFDTRGDAIERSLAAVPKEAGERYDRLADDALVYPHTSEIWKVDPDLGYAPATGALTEADAACGRMILEDVRPDPTTRDRYWDASAAISAALREAGYPLTRLSFRTVYGAGHVMTLWLARSQEELLAAPAVHAAVARVLGEERATELLSMCDASIDHRETAPLTVRHDLTHM